MNWPVPSIFGELTCHSSLGLGDFEMLDWTTSGSGPRFCLIVHHTDADREWAYGRSSHVGKLDKGLSEAASKGWTVVSMKEDWKRIYSTAP